MAKTILGIDIGHDQLKLALVRGGKVLKTASAEMPENLLKEGRITSVDAMGELIRSTMKANGIRANYGAYVLPNETVFVKNIHMPLMTVDQLQVNLPFEFHDYIIGEVKDFVFDYAVLSTEDGSSPEGDESSADSDNAGPAMELMGVGVLRYQLEEVQDTLRKAGLRMYRTAPALCSYISLYRAQKDSVLTNMDEYAVLDLGYNAIRMYMYQKDRHIATRVLEIGMSAVDRVLEDSYGIDIHMAHTYLMTNFENCQQRQECLSTYESIAVELMRAMNFYRFSNPNTSLNDIWLCGGGAVIQPLVDSIGEMLSLELHPAEELVAGGKEIETCNSYVQAIGITMA